MIPRRHESQILVSKAQQLEQNLHQRAATEVAFGLQFLHQLLKRQILMVVRCQRRPAGRDPAARETSDHPTGPYAAPAC